MLRVLRIFLLLIGLLAACGCAVYAEHPVKAFADATGGIGFEQAFWRDIKLQDWKDLDRHVASNFVYVTAQGRLERAAALEQIQKMQLQEYSLGNLESEMNGDTFVVTYTTILRGSAGGQSLPDSRQRRMTVWQRQKSGWVAIAHSVLENEKK